jgi:RecB family exonuclease
MVEGDTLFLPNYITMSDFIAKLTIVEGFSFLDDDTRTLLLLEASNFENFSALAIERNFFTFTKNSTYIFKFFEELSAEMYDIAALKDADLYGEYEEHITILQELYVRYETLCSQKRLLDRIFLPKLYRFNSAFVKKYEKIEIAVEGHLTNFELHLLKEATAYCEVHIHFTATRFNIKMQKKFIELGFEIESQREYLLSLNTTEILSENALQKSSIKSCVSFSEPVLQIAFIKQKIYEFIQKGYDPQKIAVILPNEQMAEALWSFDEKSNLNFAMGSSFSQSTIYKKLYAAIEMLDEKTYENIYRLEREGEEFYMLLQPHYRRSLKEFDFMALMEDMEERIESSLEKRVFREESYAFSKILPYIGDMNLRSVLNIFMQRLSSRRVDDVRGGKITVMGVLETRSVFFDAVIIIDFDDKSVPKRSEKDMFLNTQLREMASLPTSQERQNLQKHYYEMLMLRSKEQAICCASSAENPPSRFLKELGIALQGCENESEYANILFKRGVQKAHMNKEIIEPYSFKEIELSASRLKSFLSCKRRYYYRYVKNLQEHEVPKDVPPEYAIGNDVHQALCTLYTKRDSYEDVKELQRDLERELERVQGESELEAYLIALKKRELQKFAHNEIARFKEGWRVKYVEKLQKAPFEGMILQGRIDRIDMRENLVSVLDYKTGSYKLYTKNSFTDATDFQLEFYAILASEFGNLDSCGFYDLKEGRVVPELFFEEKMALLKAHIADLLTIEELNFELCEDTKECQFCPYALLCGRD